MENLKRKVTVGTLWNLAGLLSSRGANTLFTLVLAHFIAPDAYGLIAMMAIAFELANILSQSGLGQALIRSKSVSQADMSTVFFANIALSVVAYGLLYSSAPLIAGFYDQSELTLLLRIAGLVVFINAMKVVQMANLRRAMNFQVEMKANTLGALIGGVLAVVLAYDGAGVWSLVAQLLAASTLSSMILWGGNDWRPSFVFSLDSLHRLFRFGWNLTLEGVLEVFHQNSYVLVIGRLFSAEFTGLYFFAKKLSSVISRQLTGAVQQATFPALATLQDDNFALRHKYRRIVQLLTFLVAPAMLLLAALAETLFNLLVPERWHGAILYLQLLSLVGVLYPIHALNVNILNVKGRSDLVVRVGLLKKLVNIGLLFAAVPFGLTGIVASQVVGSILALIPNIYFSVILIGYGYRAQLLDVCKPILAAGLAAAAAQLGQLLGVDHNLLRLTTGVVAGTSAYLLACLLLRVEGFVFVLEQVSTIPVVASRLSQLKSMINTGLVAIDSSKRRHE